MKENANDLSTLESIGDNEEKLQGSSCRCVVLWSCSVWIARWSPAFRRWKPHKLVSEGVLHIFVRHILDIHSLWFGFLMLWFLKITRAEYTCPSWFTANQRKLIARILNPSPRRVICEELKHIFANERTQSFLLYLINKNICLLQRATITEIIGHEWFQVDYELSAEIEEEQESMKVENLSRTFDSKVKVNYNSSKVIFSWKQWSDL